MKKIVIASKNPVKVNATKQAFAALFPDEPVEYSEISVASNVSDQPLSSSETLTGARNRSTNARTQFPDADFYVGIEGGVEQTDYGMESLAWIAVTDASGKISVGRSGSFLLPPPVVAMINNGHTMSEAGKPIFNKENYHQKEGAIGALSDNAVTRTSWYTQAIILALIPFKNSDLYGTK